MIKHLFYLLTFELLLQLRELSRALFGSVISTGMIQFLVTILEAITVKTVHFRIRL